MTSAAPPETANPNHATLAPSILTPSKESTLEHSEADQPPPFPIDEAEPPPILLEAAPAASPARGTTSPEKPACLSPVPADVAVQVSPKAAASAPSPSPHLSPQIVEASPEDAPQPPSLLHTSPATAARTSTGPSTAQAVAMSSQEAARPSSSPESMDADSQSHTASSPLTPPMQSGVEGLLLPQQPEPASSELAPPFCQNSEPAQPLPLCHQSECTDASPDAAVDEAVARTSGKASGSSPVPDSMDERTIPVVLPALEIGPEEILPQQQSPRAPCPEAPPQGETSKLLQSPQLPPPPESSYSCSNTAGNEVSAAASGEASPPMTEAMDGKVALEIGPERLLQQPVETPVSSRMEADPYSPDMAPPGFEDFKSQWLPLSSPNPPAESTHIVVQVGTDAMGTAPDAATESLSSLEAMDTETYISPGLLPPLKSGAEGRSPQPLLGSCSHTADGAPCSPDMPPPGFENCKSSWLPLRTLQPGGEITYTLPDLASTKAVAVALVEKTCSVPVLEATDVEADTEQKLLPQLDSGTESSLQGKLPRSRSRRTQAATCSPDIAPSGFENLKLTQLQLPCPPMMQTAHTSHDSAANEAICVTSEEAPQPSLALEAMGLDMDATPALASPSESKPGRSLLQEPPLLPSHVAQLTDCSQGMVPLGSKNVDSSQMLPPGAVLPPHQTPDALSDAGTKKTITMEELCHPLPVAGVTEEANESILPPEDGWEGQLPNLKPQASPAVHDVATSPKTDPTNFENLESSQLTSPSLADTIDPSAHASAFMTVIVKSEKMNEPLSPLQATGTDTESATLQQLPLKIEERPLPQSVQHPSSPSVKDTTCSPEVAPPGYENLDSLEQLPPPPPLSSKFEMGQMVCGCCRQLLAYPRGAVHVQCFGCWTINLVLEEHQVGKVYCGQCDTLLMYPFGAPAVKCSNCLFVTEIGERKVRPRTSMEQSVSPHSQEVAH